MRGWADPPEVPAGRLSVFVQLPEREADGYPPEGPYTIPEGAPLPAVGAEFAVPRGGAPWHQCRPEDLRQVEAVRWVIMWPTHPNERGALALLVTLTAVRVPPTSGACGSGLCVPGPPSGTVYCEAPRGHAGPHLNGGRAW